MKRRYLIVLAVASAAMTGSFAMYHELGRSGSDSTAAQAPNTRNNLVTNYGSIPLHFESNKGQAADDVRFVARHGGYSLYFDNEGSVTLRRPLKDAQQPADTVRMKFAGSMSSYAISGEQPLQGKTNYLIGSDPRQWKTEIPNFSRVRYSNIYDGVDAIYYGNGEKLEYDMIVAPTASSDSIHIEFSGQQELSIAENGDLVLQIGETELRQHKPIAYQEIDGKRTEVAADYSLDRGNSTIGFDIGEYDHSLPLVIDPVLTYSTYLGGGADTFGTSIAVDSSGSAYVTGHTSALDFPTVNPLQSTSNGLAAGFVTKLNPAGTAFVYSTYISGNSNTFPSSIKVDAAGSVYIGGWTLSSDYPTTAGAYRTTPPPSGGRRSFVTKLSPSGSSLSYSTYLGAVNDLTGLALDSSGNAYLTGYTQDALFPTTPGAFKTTLGNGIIENAFVTKLNPTGSTLVYSTYVGAAAPFDGGQPNDQAAAIAVDSSGNAYITGTSVSNNYPVTSGAFQIFPGGRRDAFVTKLNANGSGLVYSTYLGGGGQDRGLGIAVDPTGNAYVTGSFENDDFPFTPGGFLPSGGGGFFGLAFLAKVNPTGTSLIYASALGFRSTMSGNGVAVAVDGSAYVVGGEGGGPGAYVVNAVQDASHSNDAWIAKVNPAGTGLTYSTPLGGNGISNHSTNGTAIAIDPTGNAYVVGSTSESDFPITPGAAQTTKPGGTSSSVVIAKIGVQAGDCPAIAISPQPLLPAVYNLNYSNQLIATGGAGPYTFSLAPNFGNNVLPVGLTLASDGKISGKPTNQNFGTYLVTVRVVDSNGCFGIRTLKLNFAKLLPRPRGLYLKIVARPVIRIGNEYTFYITYANRTATAMTNVPLLLRVPEDISLRPKFVQPDRTSNAEGYNLVRLTLPDIPAMSDLMELPITVKATDPNLDNQTFGIDAFVPRFPVITRPPTSTPMPANSKSQMTGKADSNFRIKNLGMLRPLFETPCEGALVVDPAFGWLCNPSTFGDAENPCPDGYYPQYITNPLGGFPIPLDPPICKPIPPEPCFDENIFDDGCNTAPVKKGRPSDPNEKTGSSGVGAEHYYTGDIDLPYSVSFENVDTATLPAQDVVVTDQLDPNIFDLSTFRFDLIAFGDKQVMPQVAVKQFTTDVDLRPAKQAIVRVNGSFNASSGLITWRFNTLDPTTGLPPDDPDAGFLPPNHNSPEGQGTLFFTVKAKPGLPTGTQVKNKARITFDINAPIDTPEWLNTIDTSKPTSSVRVLPADSANNFTLSWSGSDTGSGIKTYTIYVSADGGAFIPFLTDTPDTSIVVSSLQANHILRFYSIARDAVGNEESAKTSAEATTTLSLVSISGRVVSPTGLAVKGASVSITRPGGIVQTTTTSSFGYYRFDNVKIGEQDVISVNAKRYRFTPRTLQVADELTNFDFIGF